MLSCHSIRRNPEKPINRLFGAGFVFLYLSDIRKINQIVILFDNKLLSFADIDTWLQVVGINLYARECEHVIAFCFRVVVDTIDLRDVDGGFCIDRPDG